MTLSSASADTKAIVKGLTWVALFLLLGKILAAYKEVLIAARYGAGPIVDGYLFTFNLAHWGVAIFGSVVNFVLVPYLVRLRISDPLKVDNLFRRLVSIVFLGGGLASLLISGAIWLLLVSGLAGLSSEGQRVALALVPWIGPTIGLGFLITIYSAWLMSERRHANSLLEAMPSICVGAGLIAGPSLLEGWMPLAVGTLIGFAFQAILLGMLCRVPIAGDGRSKEKLSTHWAALQSGFGIMLVAQILMGCASLVDQFFAVRMGDGVLATMSFAQKVITIALSLSATAISRVMLPIFASVGDPSRSFSMARKWAAIFTVFGLVGAAGTWLCANAVVVLLFERGAFTPDDTHAVSSTLEVLGTQMPFYFASVVLVQWVGAVAKPAWLLFSAIAGIITKLVLAAFLFDLGAIGLAASTTGMYAATVIVTYVLSRGLGKFNITGGVSLHDKKN